MNRIEAIIADGVVYDVKESTTVYCSDCCDLWKGKDCLEDNGFICPLELGFVFKMRNAK